MLGDGGGGGGGAERKCLAVQKGSRAQVLGGAAGIVTSGKIKPYLVGPMRPQEREATCHLPTWGMLPAPSFWGSCQAGEEPKSLLGGRGQAVQRCPCCPPPTAVGQHWAELVLPHQRLVHVQPSPSKQIKF